MEQPTRERLLAAAERLFASRGFAVVSVRDLTREAACNVAAVSYHFGGKLNLYEEMLLGRLRAVQERRLTSIRQAVQEAPPERALEAVLRAFATAFLEPLVGSGSAGLLMELIAREMLDPQLPPEAMRGALFGPVRSELADAIVATTPGVLPSVARQCVLSIVGQLIQMAHHARQAPLDRVEGPALPVLIEHFVRFSAAGVRACRATQT